MKHLLIALAIAFGTTTITPVEATLLKTKAEKKAEKQDKKVKKAAKKKK